MSTIVTRAGKGTPLTNTEIDANFNNLNADKQEISEKGVANGYASLGADGKVPSEQSSGGGGGGGARNTALNQDPVTQGESTRTGMSSTIYTGNGGVQSIATGIDMATVDFGGLVWMKGRSVANSHGLIDSIRGGISNLQTNSASLEYTGASDITQTSTGFTLNNGFAESNANLATYVAWSFQTNKKSGFNLLSYSQDIDNAVWVGPYATITANAVTAPDGTLTADKLIADATLNTHYKQRSFTIKDGIVYTCSVYLKAAEYSKARLVSLASGNITDVDLSNGSIISGAATVVDEGNGWYRVSEAASRTGTTGYLTIHALDNAGNVTFTGNGVDGIYVWGAQVEREDAATPYMPTTTVAGGRLTNRGKHYEAHYNTDLGFSIVGYEGISSQIGEHEIPHHLPLKGDGSDDVLSIFKSRDTAGAWGVSFSGADGTFYLNTTDAVAPGATFVQQWTASTMSLHNTTTVNGAGTDYISYNFTSVEGVSKVGKYIGTGAAGNHVDCGFKPAWVLIKNLTNVSDWTLWDEIRGDGADLYANSSAAEAFIAIKDLTADGFVLNTASAAVNTLNDEYLFLAFAETNTDATKSWTDYTYPTTADTLSIQQDTLISFAEGFDASGQVDTEENVGAGVTYALGAGHEDKHYWLYKDKAGSYGVTEYRPLEGITRNDADKWGVESPLDASLRTTAKHFDYESETGVVLASSELSSTYPAFDAFDKDSNEITGTSSWVSSSVVSWLQYKFNEKRILKSWRLRVASDSTQDPQRFTIEGSNDGLNWTEIDSTYKATTGINYTGNGLSTWGNLQDTSANTTAYLYHRINITDNVSHGTLTTIAELEFNTILPSDYYLVKEGVTYNSSDVAIQRTYLAELQTDSDGDVAWYRNLPVAKQRFSNVDIHEDLTVHGEIVNEQAATAWVNFDGTQNPPLIRDSFNVKDIVDVGTGYYKIIFNTPMDDIGYSVSISVGEGYVATTAVGAPKTSSINVQTWDSLGAPVTIDASFFSATIFGGKTNVRI